MGGSGIGATRRRGLVALLLALVAGLIASGCTPDGQAPPGQKVAGPVIVQVAVYGPSSVVNAYERIAGDFSANHRAIAVSVRSYPDHDAALAAVRRGIASGHGPSLFLADRTDLDALLARRLTMPVDELLGARHIDFGDGYARNALEAFSRQAALQCMPTQLSPLVVYYNTHLVDLVAAQGPGGAPISPEAGWTFAQFARAARRAAGSGAHGVWIAPDLQQLAPFVSSAGGDVVDDPTNPTALTLADAPGLDAVRRVRRLLSRPGVAPSTAGLGAGGAVKQFEDGKLAMLLGYRDLTPQLRDAGLDFDVLPLPTLRTPATGGQVQAMCLTRTPSTTVADAAADFLAYLVSNGPAAMLARTGAVLPTNLVVESSPAFLQPGRSPAAAQVFASEVRRMHLLPTGPRWERTATVVDQRLPALLDDASGRRLLARLTAIDQAVAPLLAPPTPSTSPSADG